MRELVFDRINFAVDRSRAVNAAKWPIAVSANWISYGTTDWLSQNPASHEGGSVPRQG